MLRPHAPLRGTFTPIAVLALLAAGVAGCASSNESSVADETAASSAAKPRTHDISGVVRDQRTNQPVSSARVVAGAQQVTTDAAGTYRLNGLEATDTVTVTATGYTAPAATSVPTAKPWTLDVALAPVSTPVVVTSSLTRKPLPATLTVNGTPVRAPGGKATVYAADPTKPFRVQAEGYQPLDARPAPNGRPTTVTLTAGPKASILYITDAWRRQQYAVQADTIHPIVYKYVSREKVIAALRQKDAEGYSSIRFTFKSLTMLPTWRFPGCSGSGATTFRNAAAVEYTEVRSAPQGGSDTIRGVLHLVKAEQTWRWFPVVPGCE